MSMPHSQSMVNESLEGKLLDGRFLVRRRLGAGSFGAVYLADQQIFQVKLRRVALKLFHTEKVTQANATTVLNDAIILTQLQQEAPDSEVARYLVTVFDAGFLHEQPEQAFIAMEYVDGYTRPNGGSIRTLHGLIQAFQPTPVVLALRWMIQIAKPLAWMHTLPTPVLHCDLKPENILVSGRDTLKIADFGLAQLVFGGVGVTHSGGTPLYQAPEMLAKVLPTPAADVYALGLIFYEILVGENPFRTAHLVAHNSQNPHQASLLQMQAQMEGAPPLTDYAHPELRDHPLLREIIQRCLQFKASDRYDNAAALLRALESYAQGDGSVVLPPKAVAQPVNGPIALTLERYLSEIQALLYNRHWDEAATRCAMARTHFPKSGKVYRWLAEVHLAQGRWEEALRVCAQGREIDAKEAELLIVMANAYEMGGKPTVAAEIRKRLAS